MLKRLNVGNLIIFSPFNNPMKGHNWGLCRLCGKTHIHPKGGQGKQPWLGKTHTEETKRKLSEIAKLRVGELGSNWNGGRMVRDGYIYLHNPTHPNATKQGYVCEHRLVMEKHLGRYLDKSELVHHKDHNKTNNIVENLMLLGGRKEHNRRHNHPRGEDGRYKNV